MVTSAPPPSNDPSLEPTIDWLRELHRSTHDDGGARAVADADVVVVARAIEQFARRTPAWIEPHLAIVDRLIECSTAGEGTNADPAPDDDVVATLTAIRATIEEGENTTPCPQVVGLDIGEMACHRAEWVNGNLQLELVPTSEDPDGFAYFRVIGAEPRMWDVHGVSNARIESTLSGLNVRVPMRRSEMALIRSSY